ncbi:MAG: hypothetical protein ACXWLS_09720 [Myxococcaceae bacterium]
MPWGTVVLLGAALACSNPPPCEVALGTNLATLPVHKLETVYPTYGRDGRIDGYQSCCHGGPIDQLPDGGCGPVCQDSPQMGLFELQPPYGLIPCSGDFGGQWSGLVGAINGEVVYAVCSCVD